MTDTTRAAAAIQTRVLRGLGGSRRLTMALEMSLFARELALTRLERQHPEWSGRELNLELLRQVYPSLSPPLSLR
jgi:hypothetical protein